MCITPSLSKKMSIRKAFSLIELLVTIGVIAILIGLVIPALAGARGVARQAVCLSNLHGIAKVLESYQQTYDDSYPFVHINQQLATEPPDEDGGSGIIWNDPWKLEIYWPAVMHENAPWRTFFDAWICPGSPRMPTRPWRFELPYGGMGMSSYHYTRTFQAAPSLWMPGAKKDPSLLRAVRHAEVQFPASKVVMFDAELAHLPHRDRDRKGIAIPMLFADGHTVVSRREDATLPAENPFVERPEPLHDTPGGVKGRDY